MMELAFKVPSFRGVQADVTLHSAIRGEGDVEDWRLKDVSFCCPGCVVLPLISLVEDMYEQLISKQIGTVYVHHQLPADRIRYASHGLLLRKSEWFGLVSLYLLLTRRASPGWPPTSLLRFSSWRRLY